MTSSDREILISINDKIEVLTRQNVQFDRRISALENEMSAQREQLTAIKYELVNTNNKFDMLQTSIYWFFAAIAILAALIALIPIVQSFKRKPETETHGQNFTFSDIRDLIRLEIAKHDEEKIS